MLKGARRKKLVIALRGLALGLGLCAVCTIVGWGARAEDVVRIGLPTKTYWPTIVAETALRQKLFDKEGIRAELTIFRSGGEAFEGLAAGAADVILDPPSLVATGRTKGIAAKLVAGGALAYYGWHLMVPATSKITDAAALDGKKVGITAA